VASDSRPEAGLQEAPRTWGAGGHGKSEFPGGPYVGINLGVEEGIIENGVAKFNESLS
jgi:hypothetical protein